MDPDSKEVCMSGELKAADGTETFELYLDTSDLHVMNPELCQSSPTMKVYCYKKYNIQGHTLSPW